MSHFKRFFDNLEKICVPNYIPSITDILQTYIPSTTIESCQIQSNFPCEFIDITGQRNERRKWIYSHFDKDSLSAIIFVTSLSEYCEYSTLNMVMDQNTNNLNNNNLNNLNNNNENNQLQSNIHHSISLFKEIITYYNDLPIILVFTKLDLLQKRLKHLPLSICFNDFYNNNDNNNANNNYSISEITNFIAEKFIMQLNNNNNNSSYGGGTSSTSSSLIGGGGIHHNLTGIVTGTGGGGTGGGNYHNNNLYTSASSPATYYTHFVNTIRSDIGQLLIDDLKDIFLQKTLREHGLF